MQVIPKKLSVGAAFGEGLGRGLAESIPAEIAHQRKVSGLKSLSEQSNNLSPKQFLAKAASTYGITPQEIQSFQQLAQQEQMRNAYGKNQGGSQGIPQEPRAPRQDVNFLNRQPELKTQEGRTPNVRTEERRPSEIVEENPLNPKYQPAIPWTPNERKQRINEYMSQGFLPAKAEELAADDESREMAAPEAYQKQLSRLEENREKARDALIAKLELKTQKKGEDLFKDIPGEMINNLQRGVERDLRDNPKATLESVVNDWSNRALDLAKAKTEFTEAAETMGITDLFRGKAKHNQLKSYGDIFRRAGNAEEYYKLLQSRAGLSPQYAASLAFSLNPRVKDVISKYKTPNATSFNVANREKEARRIVKDLDSNLTSEDSLLAIAKAIRDKDPYFDQNAFFEELELDKDDLRLNERQRREVANGASSILPNWNDFLIFKE